MGIALWVRNGGTKDIAIDKREVCDVQSVGKTLYAEKQFITHKGAKTLPASVETGE